MNDFTNKITMDIPKCNKCNSKLSDTAAVFWNNDYTKIIETQASCSSRTCDYILVIKNE